jgi:hypothetical protein
MAFNILRPFFQPKAKAKAEPAPPTPEARWIEAVSEWDSDTLLSLIDEVPNRDVAGGEGFTALMIGVRRSADLLDQLLDRGADVHAKDDYGRTAIVHAADTRNAEAVRKLLEHGASIDDRDHNDQTLLMIAVNLREREIVKILLDASVDVNASSENGRTALMIAASGGMLEIARFLDEAGADLRARDQGGRAALQYARSNGNAEFAEWLARREAETGTPLVEVECLCLLPERFVTLLEARGLREVLHICAVFAGNQVAPRYHLDRDHRDVGLFTNDPGLGAGVRFSWRVPTDVEAEIAKATKAAWQELMSEIDRHGLGALLAAGRDAGIQA